MQQLKRISILGCGWLGLPMALDLIKKGYRVKGSCTSSEKSKKLRSQKIDPFLIDLNNLNESIANFFLESDILIFAIPPSKFQPEKLEEFVELIGNSEIKKVIVISSTGIYRESNCEITEQNAYSFIRQESLLNYVETTFNSNLIFETTTLQIAGLIGYDRHPGKYSTSKAVLSNPNGRVNMIHRDDVIRIVEEVIHQNCWDETFMCCSDEHPTKKEYYTNAAAELNLPIPVFENVTNDGFKIINNQKVKEQLNFNFLDLNKFYLAIKKNAENTEHTKSSADKRK